MQLSVSPCLPGVVHTHYKDYHFEQTGAANASNVTEISTSLSNISPTSNPVPSLTQLILQNDLQGVLDVLKIDELCSNISVNGIYPLHIAASKGYTHIVKALVDHGNATVDVLDNELESPLFKSSFNGHVETMRYLIYKEANLNLADSDGWTPLHNCCSRGYLECVSLLLDSDVNINAKSNTGFTSLMNAASKGFIKIVKELLSKNADPHLKNNFSDTAFDLAAQSSQTFICEMLQQAETQYVSRNTRYELVIELESTSLFSSVYSSKNVLPELTWTSDNIYKTMDQVHLPANDWFWLTEWKVDDIYPGSVDGWIQVDKSDQGILQNVLKQRKRRWIRIMKKRVDVQDDYLIEAELLYRNFVSGDLMDRQEDAKLELQNCREVIQVLMDGVKNDADKKRRAKALAMIQTFIEKAEAFQTVLDIVNDARVDDTPESVTVNIETAPDVALPSMNSSQSFDVEREQAAVTPLFPVASSSLFLNHRGVGWQKDEDVSECPDCKQAFTIFFRRHHCRYFLLIIQKVLQGILLKLYKV